MRSVIYLEGIPTVRTRVRMSALKGRSGHWLSAGRCLLMTRTGHRRPKFAVMHNTAPMNGVVGCDPRAEGPYETTRIHHAPPRRGGVGGRGARAAARENSAYWHHRRRARLGRVPARIARR